MISIDVVSESNLWSGKIKKPNIFFNSLVRVCMRNIGLLKKN